MTNKKMKILEAIRLGVEFKSKFSLLELCRTLVFIPLAMSKLNGTKTSQLLEKHFIERIQLAVTEVNGCA